MKSNYLQLAAKARNLICAKLTRVRVADNVENRCELYSVGASRFEFESVFLTFRLFVLAHRREKLFSYMYEFGRALILCAIHPFEE